MPVFDQHAIAIEKQRRLGLRPWRLQQAEAFELGMHAWGPGRCCFMQHNPSSTAGTWFHAGSRRAGS